MKKLILIIGIILMIMATILVLYGLFNMYSYHHVLDGSNELYQRLYRTMINCYAISAILGIIGLICLLAKRK